MTTPQYDVLAVDYDWTLATDGQVSPNTVAALDRWRAAGRHLLLVSGRHLPDLLTVLPYIDRFAMAVLENGSLLYRPASDETHLIGNPPPDTLVQTLRERGVDPLHVGQGNVATHKPHEATVRDVLSLLGLPWRVILNKNDVIVMPPGIDKAAGLRAALEMLRLDPARTVGVGDAENDEHLFDVCGYNVAVANALPALKQRAHRVMQQENGAGVAALIDALLYAYE
jgi:hypothetical protein